MIAPAYLRILELELTAAGIKRFFGQFETLKRKTSSI
jgi:hypothetical protein